LVVVEFAVLLMVGDDGVCGSSWEMEGGMGVEDGDDEVGDEDESGSGVGVGDEIGDNDGVEFVEFEVEFGELAVGLDTIALMPVLAPRASCCCCC
jgi:hypothetical protein